MAVEALSHLLLTYENSTMFSVTKSTVANPVPGRFKNEE